MATDGSASAFSRIPRPWLETVLGLWVVVIATGGMQLAQWAFGEFVTPLGEALWAALLITALNGVLVYGGLGLGVTYLYRASRGFEPRLLPASIGRADGRWIAGLAGLAPMSMAVAGLGVGDDVFATELLGVGFTPYPDGFRHLALSIGGVNELVNQAPLVVIGALIGGLLLGPGIAALFHGVLQDTLASVAAPRLVVPATAIGTAVVLGPGDVVSIGFWLAFAFVLVTAYAYSETRNLLVPMAAYGAFNAFALVLAWTNVLIGLYAHGSLFA